ncbi:MAG: hypothetical protein RQ751_14495, partial [Longimicrobiales bacterium]|nr:hypothetical protein [Longimicrobiales bacterium]
MCSRFVVLPLFDSRPPPPSASGRPSTRAGASSRGCRSRCRPPAGRVPLPLLLALLAALAPGRPAAAQDEPLDSAGLRAAAERAQARFESVRRRHAPEALGWPGGRCDELVGRLCLRLEPGTDWWPRPEAAEVVEARARLLTELAEVGRRIPGDVWVRGQRVAYLGEAGRGEEALA